MATTFLTIPESCRTRILRLCLLQSTWVVVHPSNSSVPGLLRTCTQLCKEGTMMFYRENTFLLMLEALALPQGHWIHKVADASSRPVFTRLRQDKKSPGNPQKWLSAFYNEETKIQWNPFRPDSGSRSRHTLVNVLRHGFKIAILLKAQKRAKGKRTHKVEQKRQRCAELILEMWCETAKRAGRLVNHFRGSEGGDFYRRIMETLDNYHCHPRNALAFEDFRAHTLFKGAFAIVDIMQDDDWQVVQQLLRFWIQTISNESVEKLCFDGHKESATRRICPRRRDTYWLRVHN